MYSRIRAVVVVTCAVRLLSKVGDSRVSFRRDVLRVVIDVARAVSDNSLFLSPSISVFASICSRLNSLLLVRFD